MSKFRALAAMAVLGVVLLGPQAAQSRGEVRPHLAQAVVGFTYFNRPGADLAVHNDELRACMAAMSKAVPAWISQGQGVLGDAMANNMLEQRAFNANVENCMVVRGWRVVKLSGGDGARVLRADRRGDHSILEPWLGAPVPQGEIARVWRNEALQPEPRFAQVGGLERDSLSYLMLPGEGGKIFNSINPASGWPRPPAPVEPLTPNEIAALGANDSVIVVRVSGDSNGLGLGFAPTGSADAGNLRSAVLTRKSATDTADGRREATMVFRLTPGRWRLDWVGRAEGMASVGGALSFCLGAPAFEIGAGEVVYAGAFELSAGPLTPDLEPAPAMAALGSAPMLASKLRPARWVNGETFECTLTGAYAVEFPGAPFVDGYAWGGALPRG